MGGAGQASNIPSGRLNGQNAGNNHGWSDVPTNDKREGASRRPAGVQSANGQWKGGRGGRLTRVTLFGGHPCVELAVQNTD